MISFYCERCDKDMDLTPIVCKFSGEEYYSARCAGCGRKLVRYITELLIDPYFKKSKKLRIQRDKFKKDLLQPGQTGFAAAYPDAQRQIEEAEEKFDREIKRKEKDRLAFYKRFHHNINERQLVKKIIEREESYDLTGN